MATPQEAGVLTYRYAYGLEKAHVVIYGLEGGAGGLFQAFGAGTDAAVVEYALNGDGEMEPVSEAVFYLSEVMEAHDYGAPGQFAPFGAGPGTEIVKLHYHAGRQGTTDFMTDNVSGGVRAYAAYDAWGALTAKAVLRAGARELGDLVLQYTVHPYDQALGLYFAQARMYGATDRRFMAMDPYWNTHSSIAYCFD